MDEVELPPKVAFPIEVGGRDAGGRQGEQVSLMSRLPPKEGSSAETIRAPRVARNEGGDA